MTELLIDRQRVSLPENLSLKVSYQNPFLTKNGVFTLELSLPLKDPDNARVYRYADRLHSTPAIQGRSAILIAGSRVLLNGTEIVFSHTDSEVSIQLVGGNSELNYFVNSEVHIAELDLGEEADLSPGYPDNAFDSYECEIVEDREESYKNVEYSLPDDTWYAYQGVSDEVMNRAQVSVFNTYQELRTFLAVPDNDIS